MTEFPKRARTIRWENGILTFDGEKTMELPELTTEIMEKLAEYNPVGFYVKNNPVTDKLLMPFTGSKNMVNFGVEYGQLTDACFPCLQRCQSCVIYSLTVTAKSQEVAYL